MKYTKKLYVSLPEELYEKIRLLAAETCRTKAGYIRQIIRAYFREIEKDPSKKIP